MAIAFYRFANELKKSDFPREQAHGVIQGKQEEGFNTHYVKRGLVYDAVVPLALIIIGVMGMAGLLPTAIGGWFMGMGLGFATVTLVAGYYVLQAAKDIYEKEQQQQPGF